jgi:hypothetical protein
MKSNVVRIIFAVMVAAAAGTAYAADVCPGYVLIGNDLSLQICDSAFGTTHYKFNLQYVPNANPKDPFGHYWKLDMASFDQYASPPTQQCDTTPTTISQTCNQDGCDPGYCPAINTSKICCPEGYLYYWADDKCHPTSPNTTPSPCPNVGDVECNCLSTHSCIGYKCNGKLYHSDGIYCSDFSCN